MRLIAGFIIIVVVVLGIVGPQALFVVDETQLGIVTRFGEALRSMSKPGLYFKTPFIEQVIYLDKRLLLFDAPPDSLLTLDKKRLIIDIYARGRITDPIKFVNAVATEARGRQRAVEIVSSELRREIGLDNQSEIIDITREAIMNKVRDAVAPKLAEFGIEIEDVRIKRADFPVEIASSVHERMKAERKRKADKERAEGAKKDLEVRADVDKQATIIMSAATRDADIIRGCGEAEAIKIFAEALEQDPEFYVFQRSLEVYGPSLGQNTTVVGESEDLGSMFEVIRQAILTASSPPTEGSLSAGAEIESRCVQLDAEAAARRLLSGDLNISLHSLVLVGTEQRDWPDAGLGCPKEGESYAQVVTPGYRLTFERDNTTYDVHTNIDGSQAVTCIPEEA